MSLLRPKSLRTRLALWYGAAVGVALLVYAGLVYGFFRQSMLGQLDDRLREDHEIAEHAFEEAPGGGLRWKEERHEHDDATSPEAPWVEVFRPGGPVLLRHPGLGDGADGPWRTYEDTYRLGEVEYLIRVGRSEAPVAAELRGLLLLFALALVPMVGLAFLGGRALARRALAPVGAMTERAKDITADRLTERLPLEDPDDELGRLGAVFNDMFARLERSFDRLRRFTADASHELRTPLTAIRSVGEVGLRERRDEAAYREIIGSMLEEVDRLTQLVDGLLVLSRGDARRARVEREPSDLAALARDVVSRLGVLAEERGQTLSVTAEGSVTGNVDALLLRHALTNVVDNAIKYGPEGSRVVVAVTERDGAATLSVSDEGPGIAPEHRDRVFERFYRVDPARPRGGAGLGLAIAKWAVEAQGGRIELESTEGKGSTFRIVLPRRRASASDHGGAAGVRHSPGPGGGRP